MLKSPLRSGFSLSLIGITMFIGFLIGTGSNSTATDSQPDSLGANGAGIGAVRQQETIPPNTPLASLTPSATLLPPPTFEPATSTPTPSNTPTITPTLASDVTVDIPGLNGLNSPTPEGTPHCEPRDDWTLTYTVQRDDALDLIAQKYGTYTQTLVEGNCLEDKNLIRVGQVLRVPGENQPYQSSVQCAPFEGLSPANGITIPANGMITFNWRGPLAPKNLLRILRPDGTYYEETIEFRQNQQLSTSDVLSQIGTYTWWIFPLDENGNTVIECPMGGPWMFSKTE